MPQAALIVCLLGVTGLLAAPRPAVDPDPLRSLDRRYRGFDLDRDGIAEIHWIRGLCEGRAARGRGLVVVLAEPRLLGMPTAASPPTGPLWPALRAYVADLASDGWTARVVAMSVYAGPAHQDGLTLLAMRRWLRELAALRPELAGVVIVGSFPEAMLVRRYNWRQLAPTVLHDGGPERQDFGGRPTARIRTRAEIVAWRSDLPLADLDGGWEPLYHHGPEDVPWVVAVYPDRVPPADRSPESEWLAGGPTPWFEMGFDRYSDFFFIDDGSYRLMRHPEGIDFTPLDARRDAECSRSDLRFGNPLAWPELLISRIDARHVALRPRADVRGTAGEGLLDATGRPQVVAFADAEHTPRAVDLWEADPELELALLLEYFERNHRYRRGEYRSHLRPASAAHGLDSLLGVLLPGQAGWDRLDPEGFDLTGEACTLAAVVEWLKRPAVLRAIAAHSDPWGCHFGESDEAALEATCGPPYAWVKRGAQLVPGLGPTGKLDLAIAGTVWRNGILPDTANLYYHDGCEFIAPAGAAELPYTDPRYGYWQGGETMLFYLKGLALVGRSKVFYDSPREFGRALGEGRTFGEAYRRYFELERAATDPEEVGGGIGRKRAYFWGLLGDWTLRLVGS